MQITNITDKLPGSKNIVGKRSLSGVKLLVIHHVGDSRVWPDQYDAITEYINEANYHIQKDWGGGVHGDGLMYHYKIDRMGNIYQTRDLLDNVWASTGANPISIEICLDGDLTLQEPSRAQIISLRDLLKSLSNEHPEFPADHTGVFGHGELVAYGNNTECPGSALKYAIEFRDTNNINIPELSTNPQINPQEERLSDEDFIKGVEELVKKHNVK